MDPRKLPSDAPLCVAVGLHGVQRESVKSRARFGLHFATGRASSETKLSGGSIGIPEKIEDSCRSALGIGLASLVLPPLSGLETLAERTLVPGLAPWATVSQSPPH